MKRCTNCRYYLSTDNPYARCLVFYNNPIAIEQLKKGQIGECDEYKEIEQDE